MRNWHRCTRETAMPDGTKAYILATRHFDLITQTAAVEATQNTQSALSIGRRFIRIARVLLAAIPYPASTMQTFSIGRVSQAFASRSVPLTVTAHRATTKKTDSHVEQRRGCNTKQNSLNEMI